MSSAICFNLDQSKILSSGNGVKGLFQKKGQNVLLTFSPFLPTEFGLTLSQTTNFRLFQIADDNFEFDENDGKSSEWGRKHFGKRRNCSLRAICSFHTVFSKDWYCRHEKLGLVWESVS